MVTSITGWRYGSLIKNSARCRLRKTPSCFWYSEILWATRACRQKSHLCYKSEACKVTWRIITRNDFGRNKREKAATCYDWWNVTEWCESEIGLRLNRLYQAGLFQHHIRMIEQGLQAGKLVVIQGAVWLLQVFSSYVIGSLYGKRRSFKDARLQQKQAEFFPPWKRIWVWLPYQERMRL